MATVVTPTPEVFFVFDSTTGSPVTGAAGGMSFLFYGTEGSANITPQPAISEVAPGIYKFTPTVPPAGHATVYMLSTGAGHVPATYSRYVRPEDTATDNMYKLIQALVGKRQIFATGGESNHLLVYDADGTTVLFRLELRNAAGALSVIDPLSATPI